MAKKKSKSRLTKTDVNAICELQRKIDAYETYLYSIMVYVKSKDNYKGVVLKGTDMDDVVSMIYRGINLLKKPADATQEVELLKKPTPGQ